MAIIDIARPSPNKAFNSAAAIAGVSNVEGFMPMAVFAREQFMRAVVDAVPSLIINLLSVENNSPEILLLTFSMPPAGAVLNPVSYMLISLDGGVPLVVTDVVLGEPAPGEIYPTTVRLMLAYQGTNGKIYRVDVSGITGPNGETLGIYSKTFTALAMLPAVVSASGKGQGVTVEFNEPIDPDTLGDPADWSVNPLAAGAHVSVINVALLADNKTAILTTLPDMTTVETYRVTAPVTIADPMENMIDPEGRIADFLVPRNIEPESATAWAATGDGALLDVGAGFLELVPWGPKVSPDALDQLVWISLFSDRRADPDDELPDKGGDPVYRGGWWADTYTGDLFGSKLWLLARSPVNATTLLKVKQYAEDALSWMVGSGIAARVDAIAERQDLGRIALKVIITKRDSKKEALNYPDLWSAFVM
jgi:phage gp46-like protein